MGTSPQGTMGFLVDIQRLLLRYAPDHTHHPFLAVFFPVFTTLNISSSDIPFTFGSGTLNFAAASFRLFLIALDKAFALLGWLRSSRYWATGVEDGS